MRLVPTGRAVGLMAAGIPVAVIAGLANGWLSTGWLWLAGPAWIGAVLVLLAVDAGLCRRADAFRLVPALPGVLEIGRAASLRFGVEGQAPAWLETVLEADARLGLAAAAWAGAIRPGTMTLDFAARPTRRGTALVRRLHLRWAGPMRLVQRLRVLPLDHAISVIPGITGVREEAMRWFARDAAQGRAAVHAPVVAMAESAEFHAMRRYQPGDNRRMINWRQSARHNELLVRETEDERNRTVMVALDTGRLMSEPLADGIPRLDHAIHGALALAYAGLKRGDRVGLFAFNAKPVLSSGTVSGPGAFGPLQRLAATLDYTSDETNFTFGLTELATGLRTRSLVVVFTDFADPTGAELMLQTVGRLLQEHVVIFVAMHDDALEAMADAAPVDADAIGRAVIAGNLLVERASVLGRLRRMGADVLEAPGAAVGPALIARYLTSKRRGLL